MAGEKQKQLTIDDLRKVREALLNINKHDLKYRDISGVLEGREDALKRADTLSGKLALTGRIYLKLRGYENVTDVDALDELRVEIIELLDIAIRIIDKSVQVRPIFEEYILKVKDPKLSQLLIEFNRIKDENPHLAAIGFRTILCLVIQEKAKLLKPTSKSATRTDLLVKPCIEDAIREGVFTKDEERRIESFTRGGSKDTFDFVAHRPGANNLVNKDDLNTAISFLNTLLPSIISEQQQKE